MAQKSYENIDIYYWTIVIIIPIIILGYSLKSVATTPEAAIYAMCFIYLDSTVLLTVAIFCITHFMKIKVKPWIKIIAYLAAFLHLIMVWNSVHNNLYYDTLTLVDTGYGVATKMTSGPLKIVHWIYLIIILLCIVTLMGIALLRKGTYSRKTLLLYTLLIGSGLVAYAVESIIDVDFSFLPVVYVAADILIAYNYDHAHAHDIMSLIAEKQKYHDSKGYAAFDLEGRYLSCNEKMLEFLPELELQVVDSRLDKDSYMTKIFYEMIEDFKAGKGNYKNIEIKDMTCQCEIAEFSIRRDGKVQGYIFDMRDITEEQKVINVMQDYNKTLNEEVNRKTENIKNIQEKVVLGLANMVENRDDKIGGHVKRTSDIIKFFVEEARRQSVYDIDDQFAEDIIRSAPMHDLGKITIDGKILNKKGELTESEKKVFETHSVKSSEFVNIILRDVEETHFANVAYNVARYHHERWDGRGYPEGLVGEMIPFEARIMAVVDDYDLILREKYSNGFVEYEEVAEEIQKGMGSKYDPNLEPVFNSCRIYLENYYKSIISYK